jgi:putative heme-binding domain-containing protein
MRTLLLAVLLVCATTALAETPPPGLPALVRVLVRTRDPAIHRDVLHGIQEALEGRRHVPMPEGWRAVAHRLTTSSDAEVRQRALALSVLFGDRQALEQMRELLVDRHAVRAVRQQALQVLLEARDPKLVAALQALAADPAMRREAIRALAAYGDKATPQVILRQYASFTADERADAIQALASRPTYASALLDALERGRVRRTDVSAFTVRQILALHDPQISARLTRLWGTIRPASQEKAALMGRYKKYLGSGALVGADPAHGRQLFVKTCASCHRLFGEGGDVGPELTGSQRANLDYILENVLDPSAVVAKDYQMTVIETKDGRVITGIIKAENDKSLTVQTQNEKIIVPKSEIESRTKSPLSMMPEGLWKDLSDEDVRDLVGYLASPHQVPLPHEAKGK